jgi:hypothetical protein
MGTPYNRSMKYGLRWPKRGSKPTVPADMGALVEDLERIGLKPKVASDAERARVYPDPQQGDEVFHMGRGHTERWYDLRTPANPGGAEPAGWHQVDYIDTQRGRLLNVYEIGWSGDGFRWPDKIKLLKEFKCPDQGVPYRVQVQASGEVFTEGGQRPGTSRFDLQAGVGGSYGSAQYDTIGASIEQGGNIFQQFVTLPTARSFTGETRVVLAAGRLASGNAPDGQWGEATPYLRSFIIVTHSA